MFITVLSPAYNKGKTIRRLYNSLLLQTSYNFEWIIINDGSTDDTNTIIKEFNTTLFPIRYINKDNEGLGATFNRGVALAKGNLLFRVDPDDYLKQNAIESIEKNWPLIENRSDICALVFLSVYENDKLVGYHPFKENKISDFFEYRLVYNAVGDRAEVVKTCVLKENPYPVFKGERICIEGLMWATIADKYKAYYINHPIYYREYNEESITAMGDGMYWRSPTGTAEGCIFKIKLMYKRHYFSLRQCYRIFKEGCVAFRWGLKSKIISVGYLFNHMPSLVPYICFVPGLLLHIKDMMKRPSNI